MSKGHGQLVSIPGVLPNPIPVDLLPRYESDPFANPHWLDEIELAAPRTCRLGLRCLYPLIEDELDPDEMPEAFTTEAPCCSLSTRYVKDPHPSFPHR